jgi:hypothetical protein
MKAEGDPHGLDRAEARRALEILLAPGERHEIRCLFLGGARSKTVWVDDLDAAVDAACSLDGTHYYSLNPIATTADRANKSTVVRRAWVLVDVDPVRTPDTSSTEGEKAKAAEVVTATMDHLTSLGWPPPLVVDSGNGWHLLYRIDLPNDKLSAALVKQFICALADQHDTEYAKIDRAVHDAARISKLPGTWSRKGVDTIDRPHRVAKIAYEPAVLEVVSVDLLKAVAGEAKAKEAPAVPVVDPWAMRATDGGPGVLTNYVKSAVDRECIALSIAPAGDRNNQLNASAFNLGTMAGWPEMDAVGSQSALSRIALGMGLSEHETRQTITSGWVAGAKSPRVRPEPKPTPTPAGKPLTNPGFQAGQPITICAEDVNPEVVNWLWEDRIAIGFISLFAGRTGVGKSFVLCDIAARLSTGREFPDGSPARPVSGTLFISEDPYQYVLVPRLIELGADRKKIGFMRWEAMAGYSLADTDFLNAAWEERGRPSLIVVDPPANFLGGKDEHKNSEVRAVLMKIVAWLESRNVAMVLITHYNKGGAQKALDALDRIMGSVAWSSSSRVACGFMIDPNDQSKCIFGGIKNNLGQKAGPLSYQITKTETLAKVEWLGKSETTLDEAMNQGAPKKADAAKFFIERFIEKLEWESEVLISAAHKAGIGRTTCFATKKALGIEGRLIKGSGGLIAGYSWFVRADWEWFAKTERTPVNAGENKQTQSDAAY